MTFTVGDYVEIICHDGKQFAGWVEDWTSQYVVLSGRGFPHEDVRLMSHA